MKKMYNKWIVPILFIIMIAVNALSASGFLVPYTQSEITNELYPNLLVPAGFTFSLWGIIYIGVALTMSLDFQELRDDLFLRNFRMKVQPLNMVWMVLNILWIIFYSYDLITLSLIVIILYTIVLGILAKLAASSQYFQGKKLFFKYPIGLHFGWLLVATTLNLNVFLVASGLDGTGGSALLWSILALVLIVVVSFAFMIAFKNIMIILPAIWALFGLVMNHQSSSSFSEANQGIMIVSLILMIATILVAAYLTFKNRLEYL